MVELKTVTKPDSEATDIERRITLPGRQGSESGAGSLSAELLVVKGKSGPIARPTPPGSSVLESVIGTDDRTRILDTATDPWRMICALEIRAGMSTFVGTGWLAGPRTVITVGHCVNDDQMGGWASEIELSPARNGNRFPFNTVRSRRFSTVDVWLQTRNPDFDIAAIHLDEPIGDALGWFSTVSLPAEDLQDFLVNISGYPADRGRGTEQWFHRNRILQVTDRRLFYDVDTFGGHSGAPVFIYEDAASEPRVVAIHAYGVGATPPGFNITANSGPRIIPEVLAQIQAWVAADTPAAVEATR